MIKVQISYLQIVCDLQKLTTKKETTKILKEQKKMMNFVAVFLVVSSLASAGMWSPRPQNDNQNQEKKQGDHQREVIVKNGHRVVVVEYDEHGHPITKVSISSEQDRQADKDSSISDNDVSSPSMVSRAFDKAMDNMKEATSALPNLGQEGHSPKELICDAYGKCKHQIARDLEMKKKIVKGTVHGAKETAHKVGEAVESAYEKTGEAVGNVYEKAKEMVSDKAHEVEETAKDSVGKAKGAAKTAREMGETLAADIKSNASNLCEDLASKAQEAKETAEHAAAKVKTGAEELESGTQKRFHELGRKGREIWYGALRSTGLSDALDALMSVANLFGLATAYGTCMWITFVSSHVLLGNLAPQQFGMVQSKIYRVYFRAMASSVGMALLGHLWRHGNKKFTGNMLQLQNFNLMAALLMIFVNMLYLEPRSTKVMFERMKMEKEEGRERVHVGTRVSSESEQQRITAEVEPTTTVASQVTERREQEVAQADTDRLDEMRERLKKLNSYSSLLNVMSLMSLSWHLVYLAQRLHS
ncbi:uncharacterized protein LOC18792482 [Prunus persica]|nr:uncharacterized protein LOC18792482 [Prunus persica]